MRGVSAQWAIGAVCIAWLTASSTARAQTSEVPVETGGDTALRNPPVVDEPVHSEPEEPTETSEQNPESPSARESRRQAARRAAGGGPTAQLVSSRIVASADAAAGALGLTPPEVTTWWLPPGTCEGCSDAHSRGGVTLAPPPSLCVEPEPIDTDDDRERDGATPEPTEAPPPCAEPRTVWLEFARALSQRLGRHHRVSLVEPADERRALHSCFRAGEPDGRPFRLREELSGAEIVVRPDAFVPPPAEVVFAEGS